MPRFLLVALVLAAGLAGQTVYQTLGREHLPRSCVAGSVVAAGDLDGDGDRDLVLALRASGPPFVRVYWNDGRARFVESAQPLPVGSLPNAIALGDLDGDGDADLVLGHGSFAAGAPSTLLRNDGGGVFTDVSAPQLPALPDHTVSVTLLDADSDRDLDLYLGNAPLWSGGQWGSYTGGQDRLLLNDGQGTFRDATLAWLPSDVDFAFGVAAGDVDRDGDPDLVVGTWPYASSSGQTRLYENQQTGFVDASARVPRFNDATRSVALGDVDGDLDLDVVCGSWGQNRLLLNDGTGTFADAAAQLPPDGDSTEDVELADCDGDGDLDLVVVNQATGLPGSIPHDRLYQNDGTGRFSDATAGRLPPYQDWSRGAAVVDLDGDGDVDLALAAAYGRNRLLVNDGKATFADGTSLSLPGEVPGYAVAIGSGDLDGDGDQDLLVPHGYYSRAQAELFLNDGGGGFTEGTLGRLPAVLRRAFAVAVGDVDSDGDLDAAIGDDAGNQLLLNDGSGHFTDGAVQRLPLLLTETRALAFGDVDADGDLDLVCGNSTWVAQDTLYRNDGRGFFADVTATQMPADTAATRAILLVDVDRDADLDLVLGDLGGKRLYVNDGSGTFHDASATSLPASTGLTLAVAAGDLDGDGDADLVWGNGGAYPPGGSADQDQLYLNDGAGVFTDVTATHVPAESDMTAAVALGDVDEDGDLDLVCGNTSTSVAAGGQNRLYTNDGTGHFAEATGAWLPQEQLYTWGIALLDVDEDGDLDLCTADGSGYDAPQLYVNLRRQLAARWLMQVGAPWVADVFADPGRAQPGDVAVLLASLGAARIPLPPIGTLGLDPSTLVVLPPLPIPAPAGQVSLTLAVPANASWVGQRVYWQAAVSRPPALPRLGNVLAETVL